MRIRTARTAFLEIKANDPDSSITERQIRALLKSGKIPVIPKGDNILQVDMDVLFDYFKNPSKYENNRYN